jgi:hypothetical protein
VIESLLYSRHGFPFFEGEYLVASNRTNTIKTGRAFSAFWLQNWIVFPMSGFPLKETASDRCSILVRPFSEIGQAFVVGRAHAEVRIEDSVDGIARLN